MENNRQLSTGAVIGIVIRITIFLAIIAAGVIVTVYWMMNKPRTQRQRPERKARLVEVRKLESADIVTIVDAMGPVAPARETRISSRVSGQVVYVNPAAVPGGFLNAGETVVKVEKSDYEIALRQKQADLAKALADMEIERGAQAVAKKEYEILGQKLDEADEALLLRTPQMARIKAAIESANAAVTRAELDLARTVIDAPFDCVVTERLVENGSLVSVGTPVASIIDRTEYWIEVLVFPDSLKRIKIPGFNSQEGSEVRLYNRTAWGAGVFRTGTVLRLASAVDSGSRLARVIISVTDPLDLGKPEGARVPLVIGSYVRAEISGRTMKDVVAVPRDSVRDGKFVHLMDADNRLEIRKIDIEWTDAGFVYVKKALNGGETLVTTDIGTAVKGMALRTGKTDRPKTKKPNVKKPAVPPAGSGRGRGRKGTSK